MYTRWINSLFGDRYIESREFRKVLYVEQKILCGWAMMRCLPYVVFKVLDNEINLDQVLDTPDDNEIGYCLLVDLLYPDRIKENNKHFPLCPEADKVISENFTFCMNENKPEQYKSHSKLFCDQWDNKFYMIHYRNLEFYKRMCIIVEKIHEIVSLKQSFWLKRYTDYCFQRCALAKTDFEVIFYKNLVVSFFGKTMENLIYRVNTKYINNSELKKIIAVRSKLFSSGIHR